MSNTATKGKETSLEQHLRDLVAGRRSDIPEEGISGVAVVYQSGPVRIHDSRTAGPVFISAEREVLVDVELVAGSGGIAIERVRFGYGPRTWRFPSPTGPQPKRKTSPPAPVKPVRKRENPFHAFPGKEDSIGGASSQQQEDAET